MMEFARRLVANHATVATFFLLLAVSAICYHKTLTNGFVQDDTPAIVENPGAQTPIDLKAIFTKNAWGDRPGFTHIPNYRPLTTFTYALNDAVTGLKPSAFHLVNLFLHALAAFLLYIFALELFKMKTLAMAASLLFTVHPLASEAVCGAVNREELLCAVFYLAGLLVFLRWNHFFAIIVFFVFSLLSKENAVTFPVAIMLTDIYINRQNSSPVLSSLMKNARLYVALIIVLAGYFALRKAVLGFITPYFIPPQDNPLGAEGITLLERILTPFAIFREMLALFASPVNLTVDYGVNVFPPVKDFGDGRFVQGAALFVLYSAGLVFFWRRRSHLFLALALVVTTFSIFSNTFVLSSIIFAERLLYLPLAFFSVLITGFAHQGTLSSISRALRRVVAIFFIALCTIFSLITIQRSHEWRDELTLYTSSLAARPDSARLNINIGKLLMDAGDYKRAEVFLRRSIEIDPQCAEAYNNLSIIAMRNGEVESALAHLKKALDINPLNGKAWNNLCGLFISQRKFQEACSACKKALSLGVRTMHYDALLLDGLCE